MKTILNQLYLPYLSKLGFFPAESSHNYKHCGLCYKLDPSVGTGYYWVYPVDNLYAITVYDLDFKNDISFKYEHPSFLSLGNYETSHTKLFFGKEVEHSENLVGYVGHEDIYQKTLNKDMFIRNVGISLTPKFYEEFLPGRYAGNFRDLIHIFSKLNGNETVPEITIVLKQIRAFQPSREIAKMYYESKVVELLSLVMHWGKNQLFFATTSRIPDWEMEYLSKVAAYLKQNYTNSISLDTLTKISCMSHNKLTSSFKQTYNSTITEYIQSLRIKKAKEMLLNSNWKIGEIANEVGYKCHGSFSEMFKKATGFTPNEFRKSIL